jgi:DNA-directed RNA polymerase
MYEDEKFEKLHEQFEPMIYHMMKKLKIYRDEKEFYQIGCIALWEASLRFNEEKGKFKSYVYSYIIGRMKEVLTKERKKQEKENRLMTVSPQEETSEDDFKHLLANSNIESISSLLTSNQSKWLKAYCLKDKTPSEVAKDEGVSISAVKAWRRDAITKLKKHSIEDLLGIK